MGDEKTAVYYARKDYAGVIRRTGILCVDFAVWAAVTAWLFGHVAQTALYQFVFPCELLFTFAYFVLLKRSRIGSLGYLLFGTRIVDHYGNPPSIFAMILRVGFVTLNIFNLVYDFLWFFTDDRKQSLRDKWCGTYVIRRKAEPIGTGSVEFKSYMVFFMTFMFREIQPDEDS